jgi:hypothetical protein
MTTEVLDIPLAGLEARLAKLKAIDRHTRSHADRVRLDSEISEHELSIAAKKQELRARLVDSPRSREPVGAATTDPCPMCGHPR